ncbi:VOC family protein [Streptomyces sp. NPDC002734]|uniref:VOC family protein n=1 Tax=Streptomyces sp. NPDC002734 TaxID=3154426 RepID=UPI00331B3540
MTATAPNWLTLFLDIPHANHQAANGFWQAATGYELSSPRGECEEFATLIPPSGHAHLRVQRTKAEHFSVHLDLHVSDLDAATDSAVRAGAEIVAQPGHVIMRSPAGLLFCLVRGRDETTPATSGDWGTHRSITDQLTIDVAHDAWDREKSFWSDLTGWAVTQSARPEFARLHTPPSLPVRVLLQRRDEGGTSSHLDIATDNRAAEVERLIRLGATLLGHGPTWTVMTGPDNSVFCVTDRSPATGLLP